MNETLLARAVHLLTLGAYAWDEKTGKPSDNNPNFNVMPQEGCVAGSIFYNYSSTPRQNDWIEMVLLRDAKVIMDSDFYDDEENILKLLHRLSPNLSYLEK